MALKLTGSTSTSSYTLLIVLRSMWGVSMVEGYVGYVCHCCTRWTGPTVSRTLWYELFSVIYIVHKLLLIHIFIVVIFLKQKLPSSIVPIQMPDHGRGQTCAWSQHDVYVNLLYSPWRWKDTYSWVVSNNEGPSILENRTEDYVHAFPWLKSGKPIYWPHCEMKPLSEGCGCAGWRLGLVLGLGGLTLG